MITIPNNDSRIINRDSVIIEITSKMLSKQPTIQISLNSEGPCAQSLGLYDLLDYLCNKFNYPKKNILITTCNLIEKHNEYNIVINPQVVYLQSARHYQQQVTVTKQFDSSFKHFGNFIGHGNQYRTFIASHLYKHYQSKTLQTYHYDRGADYHRNFLGLEDLMFDNFTWDEIDAAIELIKHAPLTIDAIDSYPILNPATLNITKVYPNFFVEIVNLTYFSGNTFYIDEKIWRPIIMRTPFMIQGPQNFILNLRKLGFKTFDSWWDEGYSEDPGRSQCDGIINNLSKLSQLSLTDMENMYQDMSSVLEHNYHRLMNIQLEEFFI